jgi:FMN phosphatase YigB (HAD superfamily)
VTLRAILFDLHGTLAHQENRATEKEVSELLSRKGYNVSPQSLKAAWAFASFIDYPKYGYGNWHAFLSRIFWRLKTKVDVETLESIVKLFEANPYELYRDAGRAVAVAKEQGFKTAIVTTIARFQFEKAIAPIRENLDYVMSGYEAGCDKSNPEMYRKVLEILKVKPEEAVMIGDELDLDVLLPKSLGIKAMLLDRERRHRGKLVDAFVYDLDEAVQAIFKERENRQNSGGWNV